MTEQPAAIDAAHPPEALLKVANPVLRRVLRTPLGRPLGEFMLVEFTGRKTGRRYSVPVSAHQLDGDLYAVLEANWKYNFRGGGDAVVHHRGNRTAMRGELITEPAAVVDIVDRLAKSYGTKRAQRYMGLTFRDDRVPSAADWQDAVGRLGIAAVKLTPV
ncbi:hypothetical protein [Mycolicibacterium sp. OfavD-34-C]|uniref:hypothetical protein n=1 Tax=Mycolicibacterium sp. OfavD-34-C TaxID=2917746 RepID=UPI001EF4BED9|nr:hypothetical protein [Mycolicibacterium sp. OfavD-34-C]MCG7578761.1 hypothetical protein [Mycolicibacterium sp. OfavD-34-C]